MNPPARLMVPLVVTALLLPGCRDQGAEPPKPTPSMETQPAAREVASIHPSAAVRDRLQVQSASLRSIPERIAAPGEVALDLAQVAKITSRIAGQVEQMHVQLGDRVTRGQPLVAISSLQLDQLIEEYLVGKAQADVAENSFRRTEKLRADDIVTEQKLIDAKGRYLETQARFQHVREKLLNMGIPTVELKQIEQGRHDKGHQYTLTAPIAGRLVTQNAVRGQGVAPGDELFEVVDTSRVWVFASLPIEQARNFKEGDTGTITPKGGDPMTAPLTYIAPMADETTRTIRVRFEVANPGGHLKPHEYVEVALIHASPPLLAIPLSALTTVDRTRGVFVARADGYAFVPVEAGREGGGWAEIRQGLSVGDQVVVDGVFDLKNVLLKEHIGSGD